MVYRYRIHGKRYAVKTLFVYMLHFFLELNRPLSEVQVYCCTFLLEAAAHRMTGQSSAKKLTGPKNLRGFARPSTETGQLFQSAS